jgi:SAM-dependent methyltransferase
MVLQWGDGIMSYDQDGNWNSTGEWGETENSAQRRGRNFFDRYLKDRTVIDIGCGSTPITHNAFKYDTLYDENYNATFMKEIEDEMFDVVYASHVLEHVTIPYLAIRNWWRILKPEGFLIIAVPERDLYEGKRELPSMWNWDHKFFILTDKEDLPYTINLNQFFGSVLLDKEYEVEYMEICSGLVYPELPDTFHKLHPYPEYQIETVIKKCHA